jgi:structure-specific recognition protein 1
MQVAYKSIARMFYLEKPAPGAESNRFFFVISLDDPVRHGNQRHPHLVMQLEKKPLTVELNVSEEDLKAGRYEGLGKESKIIEGEQPRVVAMLFKHITGKPVFKSGNFTSNAGSKAVRCSLKSSDGLLYPLDKSLMFVHKPATWMRYAEIDSVELKRGDASSGVQSRTWDLAVNLKAGNGESAREITFNALDRSERDPIRNFLTEKGVKVIENESKSGALAAALADEEDEDDDEDFEDEDDDDDDGGKSGKKRGRKGDDDDDEESEEDEDFEGGESEEESGGEEKGGEESDDSALKGFGKKSKSKGKSSSSSKGKSSKPSKPSSKKPSSKKPKAKRQRGGDDD